MINKSIPVSSSMRFNSIPLLCRQVAIAKQKAETTPLIHIHRNFIELYRSIYPISIAQEIL